MKTNQFNQVIEAAEGVLLTGKVNKQDTTETNAKVKQLFVDEGVNVTEKQVENFANEYFAKRKTGEK